MTCCCRVERSIDVCQDLGLTCTAVTFLLKETTLIEGISVPLS